MANTFPPTTSFDWLQRAALKLQKSCYRNAGFKYRKIIKELKNEIERLLKRGEEIVLPLQEENNRLKNEIKEKEKQCYDLNVTIEDLLIQAEEKSFLLENFGKTTTNVDISKHKEETDVKNVEIEVKSKDFNEDDEDVEKEVKSKDFSEDDEEVEKEEKSKDSSEDDEEIDKETKKGKEFDRQENIRKVELEMSRIKPKKGKICERKEATSKFFTLHVINLRKFTPAFKSVNPNTFD